MSEKPFSPFSLDSSSRSSVSNPPGQLTSIPSLPLRRYGIAPTLIYGHLVEICAQPGLPAHIWRYRKKLGYAFRQCSDVQPVGRCCCSRFGRASVRYDGRSQDRISPQGEAAESIHRSAVWRRRRRLSDFGVVYLIHQGDSVYLVSEIVPGMSKF